jgi:DNA polymerase
MKNRKHFSKLIDELIHSLQFYQQSGCHGFECSDRDLTVMNQWTNPQKNNNTDAASQEAETKTAPFSTSSTENETLEDIRTELGDCRRCKLAEGRKHIVFGGGNPRAELVFVGEGPGYDEDRQGQPFVGKAGQLLNKIIQAMHFKREDVYLCNVIKCRPPRNRNPEPDEIEACFPFLLRQLEVIRPRIICALGTFAAQTLLNTRKPISRLRGTFHDFHDIPLMPTFHPAYLLRNADKKREVWEDMQQIMKALS